MNDDATPKRRLRVLSLDGGSSAGGLVSALLLRRMHDFDGMGDLLERADVIVGTSAGAFTALTIAAQPRGRLLDGLDLALSRLWSDEGSDALTKAHWLSFTLCGKSLYRDNFEERLSPLLGEKRLKELSRPVIITSVAVAGRRPFDLKLWYSGDPADADARALDVALSSSAAPILSPVYEGQVDGGLMANNPGMAALMYLVNRRRQHDGALNEFEGYTLLSIGNGLMSLDPIRGTHDWGWPQWLSNRRIFRLLYDMNVYPTTDLCEMFLTSEGEDPFLRVNPTVAWSWYESMSMYVLNRSGPMNEAQRSAVERYVSRKDGSRGESNRTWDGVERWLNRYWTA